MSFGAPIWFCALLALPLLTLIFVRAERRSIERLHEFIAPRLLPQLIGNVDRGRRFWRFALQVIALGFAIVALAQPRWGYTYQDVKRKGLDLLLAVDTSRSMLSNDVQPSRLDRVKLAGQDLIGALTGDRIGLIAFAGRAFVQAPLTVDYNAVVQALTDLDTTTIPEGGTNISEAITLAARTFGKSAAGNQALIIFTDGEDLNGDAVATAKTAADNGIRIFTVGVGTPQGSLIPLQDGNGGTSFVKDDNEQVVKSKLDEKRLREIANATGGIYLNLENGPRTMQQLVTEGLTKLNAAEMDVRLARRPIERYHWPLGVTLFILVCSVLIRDRKRERSSARIIPRPSRWRAPVAAGAALLLCANAFGAVPGLQLYEAGKFPDAYGKFEEDLQNHPNSAARDRMQFDAGTAAYKMRDYNKALESFSNSLLSRNRTIQERSHYNIGRTLEDRADLGKSDAEILQDLEDASAHYEAALKIDPTDEAAKNNLDEVQKKIERLKKQKATPTPPPQSQQKKDQNQPNSDEKNQQSQKNQSSQQNQQNQQDSQQEQQSQKNTAQNQPQQNQSKSSDQEKNDQQQAFAKNEQQKNQPPKPNESPSPSPGHQQKQEQPSPGDQQPDRPPTPSDGQEQTASPSPSNQGSDETPQPTATPAGTPRKPGGELKAASGDQSDKPPQSAERQVAEAADNGQMTPQQAEALLRSMKDEEAKVQLGERRARRTVYKDW